MKTPQAVTLDSKVIISRHGFSRAAAKHLIALTLLLLALPCMLSAQTLQHEWSFNESGGSTATDSVAGANITLLGNTSLGGGVLTLPGGNGNYAQLPNGILSSNNSVTIETWLTDNGGETWARAWSFGGSTTGPNNNFIQNNYIDLIPHSGPGPYWTEFNHGGVNADAESTAQLPTGSEQYTTVTYDAPSQTIRLYLNGVQVATATGVTITPASLGFTYNNYIGLDQWNDPVFTGTFDEMRIWSGPVSQRYLSASALAGSSVVINDLTPTSASLTVGPAVVVTGTEQAAVYVQLPQTGTNELLATSDATNWISSNTNVLLVNSSGLITGVNPGTATVSATVAGINSTSGPITVSPQALLHRYSFVSDASDSIGGANGDGTIVPPNGGSPATIANGLSLPGNTAGGFGYSGYVSLPSGILTNTTSITVETWVTQNQGNGWAQIWDFGNTSQAYNFALIPFPENNSGNMEVASFPNYNDIYIASGSEFPNNSEQYVSVTFNSSTLVGNIYTNGTLDATTTYPNITYTPGSYGGPGGTPDNMLGNDIYGDYQFDGTIYEFRIWNGAVTPVYLAASAAAGPSVVITNTTPQSLNVSVITSMLGSQTQNATVTGSFLQIADVPLTSAVANWVSSDTNVLTVNGNGLITALSGGTATVSATVNGVIANSAVINVQTTAPTATLEPTNLTVVESESAEFSVQAFGGGLSFQWSFNGTPIAGATNDTLTLTNAAFADAGTYSVLITNTIGSTNLSGSLTVSAPVLLHRYSFASDASDSVGNANGSIVAPNGGSPATIADGLSLPGNPGGGYGVSGYVSLPSGILTNTTSLTVECWVTQNQANNWAEIWDFGSNDNQNFALIPYPLNNNNNTEVAFNPNNNDIYTASGTQFPDGSEQYVCLTFNVGSLTGDLYTNGLLDATQTYPNASYAPGSIGGSSGTTQNMLGNDVYGDPQFDGTIYELRIWNGAVSPLYVALSAVAGPSVVVTNFTPSSVEIAVADSSMIAGTTQPATAIGNFAQVSGVPITSSVTNWTSSDTNILTVNSAGVITAINTGSATISGTVGGVTGSSAAITVTTSAPVITQQPESSLNLLAGANLNASVGVVGNPPFVYRWYNGAQLISTTTNSSVLNVPGLQTTSAGDYTVIVSNEYGTALSSQLTVTVVPPTVYQQVLLKLNPIAYWPLSETSGTIAYDMIGGYNGEYTNGFSLEQAGPTNAFFGDSSLAAGFDGATAYVDIPEGPFDITNAITAVAWVQLTAPPGFDGLFGHGDPSWRMSIDPTSQPGGNDGTSATGDATSTAGINDGNWHMVAYTYTGQPGNSDNGSLYVDGRLVAVNTIETIPAGDDLDVWIGGSPDYGTARLLPANIAHAAVFTQALTSSQVQGLYDGVYVPPPSTTISITRAEGSIVLSWQSGVLLQAPTLNGPWTTVGGAVSPYTIPISSGSQFYRVLVSP